VAADLAGFYELIAAQVGRPGHAKTELAAVPVPSEFDGSAEMDGGPPAHPHRSTLWVREHLQHLGQHVSAVSEPALHVAELRRVPWWR
jgi:hypothetical protein